MTELTQKKCVPCEGNMPNLSQEQIAILSKELGPSWSIINEHHLEKEYTFKDFKMALEFTNKLGHLAEDEGHHPDIHLGWGRVRVVLWTHNTGGLTENDFILASKCDKIQ
jgi:4a-hydroxytetrahydrobiopterin dehydratase